MTTSQPGVAAASVSRPIIATQPGNAWTDAHVNNAGRSVRGTRSVGSSQRGGRSFYNADQINRSNDVYSQSLATGNYAGLNTPYGYSGSYFYPGAYGYALSQQANAQRPRGVSNRAARSYSRFDNWHGQQAGHHAYWPNGYNPYFGNSYAFGGFPYYFGGFVGGFGYPYVGTTYDLNTNLGIDTTYAGAPAADTTTATDQPLPPDAQQDVAEVPPAAPRDTQPASASRGVGSGPDSLVEAVQEELARLGYFGGKVDAIYGEDTKKALSRFQGDQGLAVTGRINDATLHALRLD